MEIPFTNPLPATVTAWKVKEGSFVLKNKPMLLYVPEGAPAADPPLRFDSPATGVVQKIIAQKGDVLRQGSVIVLLSECQHPTVMRDMCAECGQDLRKLEEAPSSGLASVSMIHTVPDLKVSLEQAHQLGKEEEKRLLRQRKLALLVDLDQTLIHTTNDNVPQNLEDVFHFQLVGHGGVWYHTRLRPLTSKFLENVSRNFELHICTFGTRNYAHTIAHQLDPDGKLFSHRILSREECFSQNSKTANLRDLFPHGDHMVCIIDDRDDVWSSAPNLVQVKPYHFFKHTGDIHAPPGLAKTELNPLGFEFTPVEVKPEKEAPSTSTPNPTTVNIKEVSKDLDMSDDESDSEKDKRDEPDTSEAANEGDIDDEESRLGPPDPPDTKSISRDEETKPQNEKPDTVLEKPSEKSEDNEAKAIEVELQTSSEILSTDVSTSEAIPKGPEECDSTAEVPTVEGPTKLKVEDPDDYLLYLEEILRGIHAAFYNLYDGMKSRGENTIPDVKNVIPYVRRKVLKGVRIVFSGVVPMQEKIESSRPYSIAVGLGATVSNTIVAKGPEATTHLVAARPGTAKVNEARRAKGIHIVNPNWLWSCAERWEKVDEIVFPLKKSNIKRQPPPHCSAPELRTADSVPSSTTGALGEKVAAGRKERTPSGRFMDTINPLLSFSMDEIEKMGNEVDDICNESDSSSSSSETFGETETKHVPQPRKKKSRSSLSSNVANFQASTLANPSNEIEKTSSSPNSDSEMGGDNSKTMDSSCDSEMFRNKRKHPERTETETETDEPLSSKFRRGEPLPSDLDCLNLTNEDSDDDDGRDDGEDDWMARALEREFLEDSQESKEGLFE